MANQTLPSMASFMDGACRAQPGVHRCRAPPGYTFCHRALQGCGRFRRALQGCGFLKDVQSPPGVHKKKKGEGEEGRESGGGEARREGTQSSTTPPHCHITI